MSPKSTQKIAPMKCILSLNLGYHHFVHHGAPDDFFQKNLLDCNNTQFRGALYLFSTFQDYYLKSGYVPFCTPQYTKLFLFFLDSRVVIYKFSMF